MGWQINLPFSKQHRDVYLHWNAGFTWHPGVDSSQFAGATGASRRAEVSLLTPHLAASAIWRAQPMVNLMIEAVAEFAEVVAGPGSTSRETGLTVSPGVRGGWNAGDQQVIVGAALPVRLADGGRELAVLAYLSYELPFGRK